MLTFLCCTDPYLRQQYLQPLQQYKVLLYTTTAVTRYTRIKSTLLIVSYTRKVVLRIVVVNRLTGNRLAKHRQPRLHK